MTDISLIPILNSEGWKVRTRSKLKSMKKEELIETIEMLENNWGAAIERTNNSYSYGKSEIERLEEEKCKLLGIIQGKDEVIAELKMKLLTLENKEQIVITTVSN